MDKTFHEQKYLFMLPFSHLLENKPHTAKSYMANILHHLFASRSNIEFALFSGGLT